MALERREATESDKFSFTCVDVDLVRNLIYTSYRICDGRKTPPVPFLSSALRFRGCACNTTTKLSFASLLLQQSLTK